MKSLLQNLGVILVIIGAVILIASYATGSIGSFFISRCCRTDFIYHPEQKNYRLIFFNQQQ